MVIPKTDKGMFWLRLMIYRKGDLAPDVFKLLLLKSSKKSCQSQLQARHGRPLIQSRLHCIIYQLYTA